MAQKLKLRKGKKQWFTVLAPEIYKGVEIGEITAYEPTELPGRKIVLTQAALTANPKDSQKNIEFKVSEVKGTTAHTIPWKYAMQNGYTQRVSRKYRSRFIIVKTVKTKDGLALKFKVYILAQPKLSRSTQAALINSVAVSAEETFNNSKAYDLFLPGNFDKIASDLRKNAAKIYPVSKIMIWKATLINSAK